MATLLETYCAQRELLVGQAKGAPLTPDQLWQYQELTYRIGVLETCQMFTRTAPASSDMRQLVSHYQLMDAYIQQLLNERRIGAKADAEAKQKRTTASGNLERVVQDYRKRFSSFRADTVDAYRMEISKAINTVLPVWVQYRTTYLDIKKSEGQSK